MIIFSQSYIFRNLDLYVHFKLIKYIYERNENINETFFTLVKTKRFGLYSDLARVIFNRDSSVFFNLIKQ